VTFTAITPKTLTSNSWRTASSRVCSNGPSTSTLVAFTSP
jgi:hypothetical protein